MTRDPEIGVYLLEQEMYNVLCKTEQLWFLVKKTETLEIERKGGGEGAGVGVRFLT